MRAGNDEPKPRWRLHRTRNRPLPHRRSTFFGPGRSSSASSTGSSNRVLLKNGKLQARVSTR